MIFVVSGPGGVGKGTIVARLVARDASLWLSRSWTTRPRRPTEREDAYVFVDRETFLAKAAAGGFLEHAEVLDNLYGTPVPEWPDGRDVLFEIDVQGAQQVRGAYPDAVLIFVVPPSREELARRMRRRGDAEPRIEARLELASEEERVGRAIADEIVVNDDLDTAVEEVAGILARYRSQPSGDR